MDEHIKKATEIIKQGGIVIFPTDTAFGIGCRIDRKASVVNVEDIKSLEKALEVLGA